MVHVPERDGVQNARQMGPFTSSKFSSGALTSVYRISIHLRTSVSVLGGYYVDVRIKASRLTQISFGLNLAANFRDFTYELMSSGARKVRSTKMKVDHVRLEYK